MDKLNKNVVNINNNNEGRTQAKYIPVRYIIAGLVLLCTVNLYICRANINIAIVAMSKFNKSSSSSGSDVCVTGADDNSTKSHDTGEFDWDESTQGVILGAFFYGYLVLQVVGGRLAEIYGAKWLCAGGIAVSIVINALTPLIARSAPYWLLLASRVVLGMFQAFIFPSSFALLTKWIPDHERSTFLAFPTLGANIGSIVTTALSGYLAEHGFAGGWPSVFYVAAMTASLSLLFWVFIVKSEPKDHPWISEHELNYIHSNIAANNTSADNKDRPKRSVPWLKVFTSTQVWSFFVVIFTMTWIYNIFLLKLPAYFQTVFNYPVDKIGLIVALVYVVLSLSVSISGILADYIISKNIIDKTLLRKIFESIASIGSSICIIVIPLAGCNDTVVIALLILGMLLFGMYSGGHNAVVADMTGNFTATVFSIANTIAFTTGVITPLVVGYILEASDQTQRQWGYVFYMSASINILGGLVFAIFGSAKRQDWDMDEEHRTEEITITKI